jgi:hypothetical protein
MYAKLVEGVLVEAPKVLFDSERTYSNPLPETLVAFGYKPVMEQERPEDKEGFYQVSHYEENDSTITKVWEYVEIPVVEEPVIEEEPVAEEDSDAEPTAEEPVEETEEPVEE